MENDESKLDRSIVMINDKPYAIWDSDIATINREFLDSFDFDYYSYLADVHLSAFTSDPSPEDACDPPKNYPNKRELRAALSLRMAYSQGLETLFSLLCATLQAPHCVPAWILLYRPRDVRSIIQAVGKHEEFPRLLTVPSITWRSISQTVLSHLVLEDSAKEKWVKEGFATLWSRLSKDLISVVAQNEYNSIKHGLRAKSGGFSLSMGAEDKPGVRAPRKNMRLIGHSDFGSRFFTWERIGDHKQQLQVKRNSMNWVPEDIANGLRLISMSLQNLVSFLLILDGRSPDEVLFSWPDRKDGFESPWQSITKIGVTSMRGFGVNIPGEIIPPLSEDEMRQLYDTGQVKGRMSLGNPSNDELKSREH